MFDALLAMFSEPLFWTMVVAVMVGYVFVKALPYVVVFFAYVIAGTVFVIAAIAGFFVGMYRGAKKAIEDSKK